MTRDPAWMTVAELVGTLCSVKAVGMIYLVHPIVRKVCEAHTVILGCHRGNSNNQSMWSCYREPGLLFTDSYDPHPRCQPLDSADGWWKATVQRYQSNPENPGLTTEDFIWFFLTGQRLATWILGILGILGCQGASRQPTWNPHSLEKKQLNINT